MNAAPLAESGGNDLPMQPVYQQTGGNDKLFLRRTLWSRERWQPTGTLA